MANLNINKAVDRAWEDKTLKEIAEAPVSAIEGLGESIDKALLSVGVKNIREFAGWKAGVVASALDHLHKTEKKIDFDGKSSKDLLAAPIAGFEGINDELAGVLGKLGVKTVQQLATWKFLSWSRGIVELSTLSE